MLAESPPVESRAMTSVSKGAAARLLACASMGKCRSQRRMLSMASTVAELLVSWIKVNEKKAELGSIPRLPPHLRRHHRHQTWTCTDHCFNEWE